MSRRSLRLVRVGLAGASIVATSTALLPEVADAGGMFGSPAVTKLAPEQRPILAREKVLIVYDAERRREHLIREVAFKRAAEPLAFVVPVPARPEVHAVEDNPFTTLRESFPHSDALYDPESGRGGSSLHRQVRTRVQRKIGSFETFVIEAGDVSAMTRWLTDNGFEAAADGEAWIEHYVRMGFYFVAMRYVPEPSRNADNTIEAETIRISFDTPIPFYPYREPERAAGHLKLRITELWVAATEPLVPVARRERGADAAWVRPFAGDREYANAALDELLPDGVFPGRGQKFLVQSFQDQKVSREGFGDIVLVSKAGQTMTRERAAELEPLMGVLDPALMPGETP